MIPAFGAGHWSVQGPASTAPLELAPDPLLELAPELPAAALLDPLRPPPLDPLLASTCAPLELAEPVPELLPGEAAPLPPPLDPGVEPLDDPLLDGLDGLEGLDGLDGSAPPSIPGAVPL